MGTRFRGPRLPHDLRAATTAARATARDAVSAELAQAPALVAFMNAFEALVRVVFASDTAALADFGLAPRKVPAPKMAAEKAVAAAKRKATRAARGTKGLKARQAIHGNVTATLVVTPVAPAAEVPAAPAPKPSPAAPGGNAFGQPAKG
jgi:hypothetical protein